MNLFKKQQSFDFETAFGNVCARLDRIAIEQIKVFSRLGTMATLQDEQKMQADTKSQVDALGVTLAAMGTNVTAQGTTISALSMDVGTAIADFRAWIANAQSGQPLDISVGLTALANLQAANTLLQTASDAVKGHGDSLSTLAATITQADPGAPPQPVAAN